MFKFNGNEEEYFELLSLGARIHCEFVDLEVIWSSAAKIKFLSELKSNFVFYMK
jgi:3-dehydroquinate dehydratase